MFHNQNSSSNTSGVKPSEIFGKKSLPPSTSFTSVLNLTSTLIVNANGDHNIKYTQRWFLHAQPLYEKEIGTSGNVRASLMMLNEMNHKIAEDVRISKRKDDVRGPKIIDGYENAHQRAEGISIVKLVKEDSAKMSVMINKYLSNL